MKTVQLPFFLSSRHATRNATANRFQVGLSPSVSIPREASDTRVFILEASAVHTMKNVDSTNNVFMWVNSFGYETTLTLTEGLYATISQLADGLAAAYIKAFSTALTVADTRAQVVDLTVNELTNRVSVVIKARDMQMSDYAKMKGFATLIGINGTEARVVVGDVSTYVASQPAHIDRVNSLAIAAPGLGQGVCVNGSQGEAILCRFPINVGRNEVIQYQPSNYVKSSYPLQGSSFNTLHLALLDQDGNDVDTQQESWSCTLVIEYDMP